jgi:hypothetical protein
VINRRTLKKEKAGRQFDDIDKKEAGRSDNLGKRDINAIELPAEIRSVNSELNQNTSVPKNLQGKGFLYRSAAGQ